MRTMKLYGSYDVKPDAQTLKKMATYDREKYQRGQQIIEVEQFHGSPRRMSDALAMCEYIKWNERFIKSTTDWLDNYEGFIKQLEGHKCRNKKH